MRPNKLKNITIKNSKLMPQEETDDDILLDIKKEENKRKNKIAKLDHLFRVLAHPFNLTIYLIICIVIYALARYFGSIFDYKVLHILEKDFKTIMSYVATAVFSLMFSKLTENMQK